MTDREAEASEQVELTVILSLDELDDLAKRLYATVREMVVPNSIVKLARAVISAKPGRYPRLTGIIEEFTQGE